MSVSRRPRQRNRPVCRPGRLVRDRIAGADEDRGSIAILLLVVLVGLMLSALLVPMIITQNRTTRFDTTRVQALGAAQAGLDVMLGLIRTAVSPDNSVPPVIIGDSRDLPCAPAAAPITGLVNGTGAAAYNVSIEYFTFDPVTEPYPSTKAMKCAAGYGTYDPTSGNVTPGFARLTSIGTVGSAVNGSSAGRTLTTTYVFKTSNTNIAGGVIRFLDTPALCLDAGSSAPITAAAILLQTCSTTTPPISQQVWVYRKDLTLQLLSSIGVAYPNGLCMDTAASASGNPAILNPCKALGTVPVFSQQWSYDDNGRYQAATATTATTGTLAGQCLQVTTKMAGQALSLAGCGDSTQQLNPSPTVGPGAAAAPQWVNYSEFGRCLDVTGQNVASTYLIDFPCKQNPFPGAVTWNQLFVGPVVAAGQTSATGQFYTTLNNVKYCLTTPSTSGSSVTVQTCGAGTQQWTVYGGDKSLPYSTKYTIADNNGLCLGLTTPVTWSTIDVETCTGTSDQKWNADPNVLAAALKNTKEK